jgi:hypothetical protein
MKPFAPRFIVLAAASLLLPFCAHAQLFRAYLASYGNDANPCTVAAPCRLLPAALDAVHDGGEIWMLDSANFNVGTVNVTKSVKMQAIPGQIGSIVPAGGVPAMILSPGINVTLRNVSMVTNANSPGTDGIQMTNGALSVEDSVFEVNAQRAIFINGTGTVSIHNSTFRNGGYGVYVQGGGNVDISASKFFRFVNAAVFIDSVVPGTTTSANVRDSYFTGGFTSVWVQGDNASSVSRGTIVACTMSNMDIGIVAQVTITGGSAVLGVAGSTVTGMTSHAFFNGGLGGTFQSQGNNTVINNGSANQGTITTLAAS